MLINSVIFVLQETLEAALLISVLLAVNYQQNQSIRWLFVGFAAGLIFSFLYAFNMAKISEWFDYVGQEVTNATLQTAITLFISLYVLSLNGHNTQFRISAPRLKPGANRLFFIAASVSVACAITVEGSEIFIYMSGFFQPTANLKTAIMGSSIGFTIGVSIGVLLFYILRNLPSSALRATALSLLALFAGNMLSQAALQLTQADWIPSAHAVWNTSQWLSESSVSGRLLYALIGYEATPSLAQVISYLIGAATVLLLAKIKKYRETNTP
jgi:high-affinity iron transporter